MNPFGKIIEKKDGTLDAIMTRQLTRNELEGTTVVNLRHMCIRYYNIPGMTHKRKNVIIDAILKKYKTLDKIKYQLFISEKQARVITSTLDLFSRIGIGQFERILDHPQYMNKIFDDNTSYKSCKELLERIKKLLTGYPPHASHGIGHPEVHGDCTISYDLMQVIRHRLAWDNNPEGGIQVDFGKPMRFSNEEELAEIKTILVNERSTKRHIKVYNYNIKSLPRIGLIEVEAYCVGGDEGIMAFFFYNDLFCIAEGDDGHWWLTSIMDKGWVSKIQEVIAEI